jgi:hypothetical protein
MNFEAKINTTAEDQGIIGGEIVSIVDTETHNIASSCCWQ